MKKLLNTTMLACALFLFFISCSKETDPQPPSVPAPPAPITQPTGTIVSSNNIDLEFQAYSSLPPTTMYTITVNGTIIEEFNFAATHRRRWQLHLNTGTNTVHLYASPVPHYITTIYSSFFFIIDDHSSIQRVAGTDEKIKNFSFIINVVN